MCDLLEADPGVASQQAGGNNGTIREKVEWEESFWRQPFLPDPKHSQRHKAKDDHTDNHWRLPSFSLISCKTEWKKDEREASTDQKQADNYFDQKCTV